MIQDWILDVFSDLRDFAGINDMDALVEIVSNKKEPLADMALQNNDLRKVSVSSG